MKDISTKILSLYDELQRDSLDLHTFFEMAGEKSAEQHEDILDAVAELVGVGMLRASEGGDFFDRSRIHADQSLAQSPDDATQALGTEILHELGPADQAFVGGDLQKREIPPAGVAVKVLDFDDAHDVPLRVTAMLEPTA